MYISLIRKNQTADTENSCSRLRGVAYSFLAFQESVSDSVSVSVSGKRKNLKTATDTDTGLPLFLPLLRDYAMATPVLDRRTVLRYGEFM